MTPVRRRFGPGMSQGVWVTRLPVRAMCVSGDGLDGDVTETQRESGG